MKPTPTEHFDIIRPSEVRLLARRNGKRVTTPEIARRARLSINTINLIARRDTWAGIKIGVAERFATACGHDLLRPRRTLQYLRRVGVTGRGFKHLTKQQLRRLIALLERLE